MSTDSEHVQLPENDDNLLKSVSDKLPDPEDQEVISPKDLYKRYQNTIKTLDSTLALGFRVDDTYMQRNPGLVSEHLELVGQLIKELQGMKESLLREIFIALGIQNNLIWDTETAAVNYLALQPKQHRIAAESIRQEYYDRISEIASELLAEEKLQKSH